MLISKALSRPQRAEKALTLESLPVELRALGAATPTNEEALKLSAVYAALELTSNSVGKLPQRVIDLNTRKQAEIDLNRLLTVRPNEAMTPFVRKKMLHINKLATGNAYEWIVRRNGVPVELIPVPSELVQCWKDGRGAVWYDITNPKTGEPLRLHAADVNHYKCFASDGLVGKGVLRHAAETVRTGLAAQRYETGYYENGAQPSGILMTETDLSGKVEVPDGSGGTKLIGVKDAMRREWEKIHSGPSNAHRIAILDYGLKYQPVSISQADAQFVESKEITVEDIARFFCVPLYKLQAGKQSYNSNEQNAIEYISNAIHPHVCDYEEEMSYKLLSEEELARGMWVRINMMAELKGDTSSRGEWYKTMSELGVFSPNDICDLEDRPDVPGGDVRRASLNYIPLEDFRRLSTARNGGTE